ncbi:hypothetical protein F5Y15DRAFT_414644 [Xylariaceae sp. FL0016]|nr:hypothetical protein F5Y15DRAFT_414644 [Xylariaceae sp. FL0016]
MSLATNNHPRTMRKRHPEVSEFMVRCLDGRILPAFEARPDSGVTYDSHSHNWIEERQQHDMDLNEIYADCVVAQRRLTSTADKLARKRKIDNSDLQTNLTWSDIEISAATTCDMLQGIAKKNADTHKDTAGRLRRAFNRLCNNAGAGVTLSKLVPSDGYTSIICGGLNVIFTALQKSGLYRKEVLDSLEVIPSLLQENAALLELDKSDEGLHRRVAAIYEALFELMQEIMRWFLQNSFVAGAKFLIDPSKYSNELKSRQDAAKLAKERLGRYVDIMSAKRQEVVIQQNRTILFNQETGKREILKCINDGHKPSATLGKSSVLEKLEFFLDSIQVGREEYMEVLRSQVANRPLPAPSIDVDEILDCYEYETTLVETDCTALIKAPMRPGCDANEDRILTIQTSVRLKAWLILDSSSLLLIDANSDTASHAEMSYVSAKIYMRTLEISKEQTNSPAPVIAVAFFCGQHRNELQDPNGTASELAMNLLLQLIDQYRDFAPETLGGVMEALEPHDLESICSSLITLLAALPPEVILVLIIDDLRAFTHSRRRKDETRFVVEILVDAFHSRHTATLKFLFASSTRLDFIEDLFEDEDIFTVPRSLPGLGSYITSAWRHPLAVEGIGGQ